MMGWIKSRLRSLLTIPVFAKWGSRIKTRVVDRLRLGAAVRLGLQHYAAAYEALYALVLEKVEAPRSVRDRVRAFLPSLTAAMLSRLESKRYDPAAVHDDLVELLRPADGAAASAGPDRGRPGRRKILYVSGMFPSFAHGGGLRLFDLISLMSADHEIDLYGIYQSDLDRAAYEKLKPRLGAVRRVTYDTFNAADALRWLARRGVQPGHYDVIHFEYGVSTPLIPALKPFGRKTAFTLMECNSKRLWIDLVNHVPCGYEQAGQLALDFAVQTAQEKRALNQVDIPIAVTPEDAAFIRQFGTRPLEIIPTCLSQAEIMDSVERYRDRRPAEPTASFVGYFNHYPNNDGMLWYLRNVHDRVRARVPGFKLLVFGRGDTRAVKAACPSDGSVEIVGEVADIIEAVSRTRLCIAPLISGAGIRGKINQYAAARRPVVTTSIGAAGLPYVHPREIWIADDPAEFAAGMVSVLTHPKRAAAMSAAAEQTVKTHYLWAPHIKRLESLYGAGR